VSNSSSRFRLAAARYLPVSGVGWERLDHPATEAGEGFATPSAIVKNNACVGSETACWYRAGNERLDQGEPEKVVLVERSYIEIQAPPSGIS
jgi:hypothetical protein